MALSFGGSAAALLDQARAAASSKQSVTQLTQAFNQQAKAGKEAISPLDALRGSMASARSTMGAMAGVVSSLANVGKMAALGLGPVGAIIAGLSSGLMAPIEAIQSLAQSIIELVQLANPGAVQQFMLVLNDAMAVLGGALTPVLQALTIYVKTFGDTLAALMPIFQPLFDALARHIVAAAQASSQLIEAFAPLIELFVDMLVPIIMELTDRLMVLQGVLIEVVKTIMDLFGLKSERLNPDASSTGAAVRRYSVQSTEGFSKALFEKQLAMLAKGGQGKDPIQHIPDIAKSIEKGQKIVAEIRDYVKPIADWFKRRAENVRQVGEVADTASGLLNAAGGVAGALAKAFIK